MIGRENTAGKFQHVEVGCGHRHLGGDHHVVAPEATSVFAAAVDR